MNWAPFGLGPGNFCDTCGRAKSLRLYQYLTGCEECDKVITRHRCVKRPELQPGEEWTCPDCDSIWMARLEEEYCPDCCGSCEHTVAMKRYDCIEGDRILTAPKYVPQPFTPFRNRMK